MNTFELGDFFLEDLADFLRPFFALRLLAQLLDLDVVHISTQLFLNGFDLLLKEIFFLLFVDVFVSLHLNRCFQFDQLILAVENKQQSICTVFQVVDGQKLLFFGRMRKDVATCKTDQIHCILIVADGIDQVAGRLTGCCQHLYRKVLDG